jgi:DNA-binding transcriptional ArsR family regulator
MNIPNLFLIAGTGNKSGKTTLACRVIEQFRDTGITGIKITPHFHETIPGLNLLEGTEGYSIYEETDPGTQKDTSRMLRSGAAHVYFAKVTDGHLADAFKEIMKLIPEGTPVVCESPALRHYVEPGLFIIMKSDNEDNSKNINNLLKMPHVMIHLNELQEMGMLPVIFEGEKWIYKEKP